MDNRNKYNVDEFFRSNLENSSVPVSNDLWNKIEIHLDNDRLKRKVVYARFVAAASFLLLIGVGTLFFFTRNNVENTNVYVSDSGKSALRYFGQENANGDFVKTAKNEAEVNEIGNTDLQAGLQNNSRTKQLNNVPPRTFDIPEMLQIRNGYLMYHPDPSMLIQRPGEKDFFKSILEGFPGNADDAMMDEGEKQEEIEGFTADDFDFSNKEDKKRLASGDNKWSMGGAFSPDMNFSTQAPQLQQTTGRVAQLKLPDDPTQSKQNIAAPVVSFSTGLNAGYNVGDRVAIRSGVMYTKRSTTISDNISTPYGGSEFSTNFDINFLEVPVNVKYNVVDKEKVDFFVSSGVSSNFLLNYNTSLETQNGRVAERQVSDENSIMKFSQANLSVSTGVNVGLLKNVSLNVEPGLKYGFKTTDYSFSSSDPVTLNLLTGISYKF